MCQIIASAVRTRWISFAPLGLLIPIDSSGAALRLPPAAFFFAPPGQVLRASPKSDSAPEARETVAPADLPSAVER